MVKNNLYSIRAERNISLRQLERMSGISRAAINKIENGHTDPSQTTMVHIAKALKLDVTDVFHLDY